ncbi:DUF6234 family protein [Streptomyces sp. HU2014]|uniref:DUF6234 family protein n=1 Tax=Streptomyces sp. HU2014 TaxID=2939414 RepID=UPI00200FBC14|nr:DUF6234 family protein [Streptomyces sp. HU2014]UQI45220.1 DUF6234 family protein [Streptomyces sp. HU2014]
MMFTSPAPERRRPWSHRTRRGVDLAFAIPLFLLETAWLVLDWMFGLGLEVWAAQGERERIDAARLAHLGRVRVLLIAVLVTAVLAGIFRARWTVIAHLLVAVLAGGVLVVAQHQWDSGHAPSPGCVRYSAHC